MNKTVRALFAAAALSLAAPVFATAEEAIDCSRVDFGDPAMKLGSDAYEKLSDQEKLGIMTEYMRRHNICAARTNEKFDRLDKLMEQAGYFLSV